MNIKKLIYKSKKYLKYKDNWDEEGSPGYKKETLERTELFLRSFQKMFKKGPEILPGPGGSFDVFWKISEFKLLVNIPEDSKKPITSYGE